ncbi:MAG: polymerase, sigma-24 subunit, subfamily [Verrucomicrobiales bacterium]|nr:polymerase, sigma-24 subunit, subfamily [Verrucomicrobiales bacterium]
MLRDYAESRSESAFAELVRRHVDLVYSAALRMVRDTHLAEDVTQGAFVVLSQNAAQLTDHPVLSGWLHRTAQNLAVKTIRSEVRRRAREQESVVMNELLSADSDATWDHIAPHLDHALSELTEADRDALLLRYFERKSAREMAQTLGVSDEAAQKRVNRAVERLRELFLKRGLTVGAGALGVVISANAVQAAPISLATTVLSAASLTGASIATATTAVQTIVMTTTQKVIFATVLTAIVGVGVYETRRASQLESRVHTLENQQGPLTEQMRQISRERDDATNKLAASVQETERLRRELTGLPKMRGEMARLQQNAHELAQVKEAVAAVDTDQAQSEMKAWLTRVHQLKQRFDLMPQAKIPEFQLLTEQDWLTASKGKLDDETDFRRAMSALRSAAENKFVNMLQPALHKYLTEHQDVFPTDVSELRSYFYPEHAAILEHYTIVPASDIPNLNMGGKWIITEKTRIDSENDAIYGVGPNGWGNTGLPAIKDHVLTSAIKILTPVMEACTAANNGKESNDPARLIPFLKTPEQRAAYDQVLAIKAKREAFPKVP